MIKQSASASAAWARGVGASRPPKPKARDEARPLECACDSKEETWCVTSPCGAHSLPPLLSSKIDSYSGAHLYV